MSHTPGPWTPHGWGDNDYEINAAEGTVCNVPGFDDDTAESDMAEHNARLIAAAPELLAALKDAYDALDYAQAQVDSDDDRWHLTRCRRKIKPVIDKAEGRSE